MKRQNNSFKKFIVYLISLLIIAGAVYLYYSPIFEKNIPKITMKTNGFWNLKSDLLVSIEDESGIKNYSIYYQTNNGLMLLDNKNVSINQKTLSFNIPKIKIGNLAKKVKIIIEATDNSKWNFFEGNKATKEFTLIIDRKRPLAQVIANSYNIKKGGSAVVVVKVKDDNLKDKYISFNNKYKFQLIPYMKKDYYAAIIAWPVKEENFNRVSLIAIDKANNISNTKIPLYIKDLKIKDDKIKITKEFIENISVPVLQKSSMDVPQSDVEIFVQENKKLRKNNVDKIREVALEDMSKDMIKSFKIKPFKRLRGSKTFAGFAERRSYYYNGEKIDQAWHLGIDWASIKHAPIRVSNYGEVIFNDFLGIYGNALIIDHKFGLQSLYAHTSKFNVKKGDFVKPGQKIANTGATGAVFGDHLHFGVLVQGIEVNPLEWMDKNWIKTRIYNILDEANEIIKSGK